ncbi:MAG: glutamate-1-semialdehyde 2,1-aminomutase [Sulfobacillus sp.]
MGERSHQLYTRAIKLMPGGVNSPVRAFGAVGGEPFFTARAAGPYLYTEDGERLVDYVSSWGPLILGHAHPAVVAAITEAAANGTSFGTPSRLEVELAARIQAAMPSVERIRMVNSGTEATMSAIRLARAATGRSLIVKFVGCYHGHVDALMVSAGSGMATLGIPSSPGVTEAAVADTVAVAYNDLAAVQALFAQRGPQVAAVIVEPVAGNMGVVPAADGFLAALRQLTTQHGALLIFDEVITGFRVAYGGAQSRCDVPPDLTCLGKVIGGGLPVGAYGGRRDLMEMVAPAGKVYQAGTLSGNPLAMAAGIAALDQLVQPGTYARLEEMASMLADGLAEAARVNGVPLTVNRAWTIFTPFFSTGPVRDFSQAQACSRPSYARYFHGMLDQGVFVAPSQFEAVFVSLAHDPALIERTVAASRQVFAQVAESQT